MVQLSVLRRTKPNGSVAVKRVYQDSSVRLGCSSGSPMDQGCPSRCVKVSSKTRPSSRRHSPIPTIARSSLDRTFGNLDVLRMGLVRHPARRRSRPIQHDSFGLSGIMHNLKFLPTPPSEINQLGLARFERMCGLARSGEPIEFPGLDGLFARFCGCVVEDDPGVGPCFDYVEPFVFGAVPMWDGGGVMRGDGYEVDASLSKTTWIAEVELVPLDGFVQRV